MLTCTLAEPVPGMTCTGVKLTAAPFGKPLALSVTSPVKGVGCALTTKL